MKDRRRFLKCSALAGGLASLSGGARAQAAPGKPSPVSGYEYRLPKLAKGSRLLFLGDSITDMKWGRNEKDRNHYLGHSYVYLIAARLGVDLPEAQLDIYNRGISGNKVGDLRKRWQKDAIDMKPDLLSILIGTNDCGQFPLEDNAKTWEADYRFLLESSRAANPALKLVLLDPFALPSGRFTDREAYRARREPSERMAAIVARLAKDYGAVHIRTQEIFDAAAAAVSAEHWLWDGVHPLPQGHELIARAWIEAVAARG